MPEQDPTLLAIGRTIRQLRETRGMTPAELASTAGVEPQQLEALEAGRSISTAAEPSSDAEAASAAFGHRMCELRAERSMSQDDLADRTDMHPTAIGRIERGKREPRLTTILRIARGLDVQPGALLNELAWPDGESG